MHYSILSVALGMALSATAQAQLVPAIGDAVRQTQPPMLPVARQPGLPVLGGTPAAAPIQVLPGGGPEVLVTQFDVTGNQMIDSATLLALVATEQGKRFSLAQLDVVAARLTYYYRTHGYFVARAYIPAQEIVDGKLTLHVIEGNYGKFVLNNRSLVGDSIVQGLLDDVKDRHIVSLDTLERAMLIINDTPGVKVVRADIMPGERVGTSDFAISTEATAAHRGYLLLDNDGSSHTGKERLSFGADWNSPSARGDRLSASGMVTNNSGLLNGRLAYSILTSTDGTRAEAALSRTSYELGGAYAALQASGTANGADLNFSKPIKRTRNHSIEATLNLTYKDLTDKVAASGTEIAKQIASISTGISVRSDHILFGYEGLSQASASVTLGNLHFKDAVAAALDAAGAHTQGGYAKLNLGASRTSALPSQFMLTTDIKAQMAIGNNALDGVERMSVSGAGGVAAYPTGELSADHAVLARAELAHPLMQDGPLPLRVSAFADYGWTRQVTAPAGARETRTLGDVGLSLSGMTTGGALLKLQLAHRMVGGLPTSESTPRTRLLFQIGWIR